MVECPKDLICFTEDEWFQFLNEYEVDIIDEVGGLPTAPTGDAQAAIDFTWEILFLTPWELAYIALPMTVLAFYGLTIYSIFKYVQSKF
jgi:hypothetical protein